MNSDELRTRVDMVLAAEETTIAFNGWPALTDEDREKRREQLRTQILNDADPCRTSVAANVTLRRVLEQIKVKEEQHLRECSILERG